MTDLRTLVSQARGGRVVRTGFVEGSTVDRRALAADGVRFAVHGGFPDPSRVIYTLYPEHIPNVDDPVKIVRLEADFSDNTDVQDIRVAINLPDELLGDIREQQGMFLVATLQKGLKQLQSLTHLRVQTRELELQIEIMEASNLERSVKTREVVVPSMRVDVVGAKGFGVSRAYFQAGIEGKNVRINGQLASSSTSIREGDTLVAERLGRIEFKRVINETRRGNYKLELEVHKS
jgi:RNA-binding protein YlmH